MSAFAWAEDDDGNLIPFVCVATGSDPVVITMEPAFPELEETEHG